MKFLILFSLFSTLAGAATIDCEYVKKKDGQDAYDYCLKLQEKFQCEEVNEQYTICNGNKYVRELKNSDGLKRDAKKIEEYIDTSKSTPVSNAISK